MQAAVHEFDCRETGVLVDTVREAAEALNIGVILKPPLVRRRQVRTWVNLDLLG